MHRNIAVTHLADYAADPEGHIQRKGRPRDPAAARSGRRAHAVFDSHRMRNAVAFGAISVSATVLFLAPKPTLEYGWWLLDALRTGFVWLMERL